MQYTDISCDTVVTCLQDLLPTLNRESDLDLFDAGIIDSLNLVDVVVRLEQEFGIVFAPADVVLENFATVEDIRKALLNIRQRGTDQ